MDATNKYSSVEPAEEDTPQQSSSSINWRRVCVDLWTIFVFVFVIIYGVFFLADQAFNQVPHYSVAIDHVSGLDPATDLGRRPTLEPEFNLTFRVASLGLWATECAEPRMYATVSYRGVSLAASGTLTQRICAGPLKAVEHHLVARGAGVVVPGSVLASLAMDMHSVVPGFDVELHGPGPRKMVWPCGPRMLRDPGDLDRACTP